MALLPALLLAVLLAACASVPASSPPGLPVYVVETEGVFVLDNSRLVEAGEDVVFRMAVSQDLLVTGAELDGSYTLTQQDGYTVLTVTDIRFPTRITLQTQAVDNSGRYVRTLSYDPNGGTGEPFSVIHDIREHTRPNTARGGFSQAGRTLVGWNTSPDGTGTAVGLGSRVTVPPEGLTLYAQWAEWADADRFGYGEDGDGIRITGYSGQAAPLVIPQVLDGRPVTAIAAGAFRGCAAQRVVLPPGLVTVEDGAFENAAVRELTLFDDIEVIGDGAFVGCDGLRTLRINAVEDPYGHAYRRESVLADKVDLLIDSLGQKKLVFYGGCSTWYNLIGSEAVYRFGPAYQIINMGLNGTVNSLVQMEIIGHYLEAGDIFVHTPELSSTHQLLTYTDMYDGDDKLWCGLEYNYDLFSLVDIRGMAGVFDSLRDYLSKKEPGGSYRDSYRDTSGNPYLDSTGSIPWTRTQAQSQLSDEVTLDPERLAGGLPTLAQQYCLYRDKGVRVYVSYACVDVDGLPPEQRDNVELMDSLFRETVEAMDGPVLISSLSDYLYPGSDFYDTHYHLLTQAAYRNTALWLRDLSAQMERDGLWP